MERQTTASDGVRDATFAIEGWSVDTATLRISKQGKSVKIEPKAMAVLEYLASRPGQVVSRMELEENIWAGSVVGYDAISNAIIKLRKAFGDSAHNSRIIETISKSGYRLITAVETPTSNNGLDESSAEDLATEQVSTVEVDSASRQWLTTGGIKITMSVLLPLALLILVLFFWFSAEVEKEKPASLEQIKNPLPDQPSIAVMPFTNMSADPEQEYFADGMTEDLITDLSKLTGLFVVARNSVFTYKGRAVKVGQVGEELGVRYVLEGSVRRSGDQVRINAQLIDASSGGHIWAERYDGTLTDIFTLQDQITLRIVEELALSLELEAGEPTVVKVNAEAYDLYLKGWGHYRAGSAVDFGRAVDFYQRALAIDPDFARARAALASVYLDIHSKRWWQESLGIRERVSYERSRLALKRSKELPVSLTHQVASETYAFYDGTARRALIEAEKAIALSPNDPGGHLAMSYALLKDGRAEEAERSLRSAMRLDPHFPPGYLYRLGQIQFHLGQFGEASNSLQNAIARNPDDDWVLLYLAACYGMLNQVEPGQEALELANALRAKQGWGPITILVISHSSFGWRGDIAKLKDGLRAIGTPPGGEWYQLISQQLHNGGPRQVTGATTIDAAEAKALHDRGAVFVDTNALWFKRRIPGAVLLEVWKGEGYRFNENALRQIADFDDEIVIYGAKPLDDNNLGKEAATGAAIAVSKGFKRVYYFPAGMDAWENAGYPIVRPD